MDVELLRDASDECGRRFFDIVQRRDQKALNQLIVKERPDVLWGKYFNLLSPEDQVWASRSLAQ